MILVELFQSLIFTSAFVRVDAQLGRCRDRYPNCHLFALSCMHGPLAQSVERGADNAKVVSSILTRTREYFFVSIKPSEQNTNL